MGIYVSQTPLFYSKEYRATQILCDLQVIRNLPYLAPLHIDPKIPGLYITGFAFTELILMVTHEILD